MRNLPAITRPRSGLLSAITDKRIARRCRATGLDSRRWDGNPAHHGRTTMLTIDLRGKRAFVAGVADDGGFGFAIAKALVEAGATVCLGTWPPALNIFQNLLERGKMDASRKLSDGSRLEFEKIYPLDAAYDTIADAPEDIRGNKRYKA